MKSKIEEVKEMISADLDPGEKIQSIGFFRTGPPLALMGTVLLLTSKYYYIGVTNKRLFVIRMHDLGRLDPAQSYHIPLKYVEIKGHNLWVDRIEGESPQKYFRTGALDMNIQKFEDAIKKGKKNTSKIINHASKRIK
jgi:hypothetical protein